MMLHCTPPVVGGHRPARLDRADPRQAHSLQTERARRGHATSRRLAGDRRRGAFRELARAFVASLPGIEHFLDNHAPPFIAKVYRPSPNDTAQGGDSPGRVELWYPR